MTDIPVEILVQMYPLHVRSVRFTAVLSNTNSAVNSVQTPATLTDIPIEILVQILNHLSFLDLKNTEEVSSYIRWHYIVTSVYLCFFGKFTLDSNHGHPLIETRFEQE